MTDFWKVHAFSLATIAGAAYMSCAIFDVLFPPFGLFGLLLSPIFAGAAMALSSVSVVTNALRLNRVKL